MNQSGARAGAARRRRRAARAASSARCRPRPRTSPGSCRRAARGCKLRARLSPSTARRLAGSLGFEQRGCFAATLDARCDRSLEHLSVQRRRKCSTIGPRRQGREEGQGADDERPRATSSAGEQRAVGGEGAQARRAPSSCRPSSRRWPAPGRSSGSGRPASSGPA